jgi:ATP-binding cassette subfamily C protein
VWRIFRAGLSFMTKSERAKWLTFVVSRAMLSFLDLLGILGIGYLATSAAVFLTTGSDPDRIIEFSGFVLPAINAQTLPFAMTIILLLFLGKALASIILSRQAALHIAKIEARASRRIAEIQLGRDISSARQNSREEVMFAVSNSAPAAFNTVLNSVSTIITETSLFLTVCLGFLLIDAIATLATLIYFAIIAFTMQVFVGSLMSRESKISTDETVKANSAISDLIAVFRELLVLGKRDRYLDLIYKSRLLAAESSAKMYFLGGMPRYIIESALLLGLAVFLISQALNGDLVDSAATIGVFLSGGFRLTAALLPLQNSLLTLKSIVPPASIAHEVLGREEPRHIENQSPVKKDGKLDSIVEPVYLEFQNVSLKYDKSTSEAISDVSFSVQPGMQLALMGASGSGKSTIADLICGVLSPSKGNVLAYSKKQNTDNMGEIPKISYVPQRPGLVAGTVLDNIALADEPQEADRERALSALNSANLKPFIESLPKGLDTPIGKLQDGFSGGQIQRLGLARALYSNPGLLVLDEATSSLDAESEEEIRKAVQSLRGKVTVILIAHRLNTIQHADEVLFLDSGRIADSGKFNELVERNPEVKRLVALMSIQAS